jgi:hypothetical protein
MQESIFKYQQNSLESLIFWGSNTMKRKKLLLTAIASLVIVCCLWYFSEQKKGAFPENLELSNLIMDEGDWIRGCGIIVFAISNTTASKIDQGKLAFFEQAVVSRNKQNHYRWQQAPFEEGENANDSFTDKYLPGFECAKSNLAHKYKSIVSEHIKINGTYYAKNADRHLVVISSRQLMIFEYSDR